MNRPLGDERAVGGGVCLPRNLTTKTDRHRFSIRAMVGGIVLSVLTASAWAAQYTYDSLGRLKTVLEADGTYIQYEYDANGNRTLSTRTGGNTSLSITSFSPATGPVGTVVTINGQGFSSVLAQNTVKFNGVTAALISTSPNVIRATVPAGATTGVIAITTPQGTASSAAAFVLNPVAISNFTPSIGASGTAITIAGAGFSATPASNAILVHATASPTVTATTTQLTTTVPAAATSGRIRVTTPAGTALSGSDFIVPAAGYATGDIATYGRLDPNGVGKIFTINTANKVAVALFDGTAGQRTSLVLTNLSLGGQIRLYQPDGTLLIWSYTPGSTFVWDLDPLPATGTYSLYFVPGTAVGW